MENLFLKASVKGEKPNSAKLSLEHKENSGIFSCDSLAGWADRASFVVYEIDSSGIPVAGTETDWIGEVNRETNVISNAKITSGNDRDYAANNTALVACETAEARNMLIEGISKTLNPDGSLKQIEIEKINISNSSIPMSALRGLKSDSNQNTIYTDSEIAKLADVARTGSFNDLKDKPSAKKFVRIVIGASAAGYTADDVDYLCDGTDDQNKINTAIRSLPINGGEIKLLDGVYNITAPILINKDNITISGAGKPTQLKRMWNSGDVFQGIFSVGEETNGITLHNLYLNNNAKDYPSANNLVIKNGISDWSNLRLVNVIGQDDSNTAFKRLKDALDDGTALELFPLGSEIADSWTDPQTRKVHKSAWVVAHYGESTLEDGNRKHGVFLIRKNSLPFKLQFDKQEPGNNENSAYQYGNSRYSYSAIQQYLNSDKSKGNWWSAKHSADVAPDYANTRDGFIVGCSEPIKKYAVNVKISCFVRTGESDTISAKFFLPSARNLNSAAVSGTNLGSEGGNWLLFGNYDSVTNHEIFSRISRMNDGIVEDYWTRSNEGTYGLHNIKLVTKKGGFTSSVAKEEHAVRPACFIC